MRMRHWKLGKSELMKKILQYYRTLIVSLDWHLLVFGVCWQGFKMNNRRMHAEHYLGKKCVI